jgi:hypothetical protein
MTGGIGNQIRWGACGMSEGPFIAAIDAELGPFLSTMPQNTAAEYGEDKKRRQVRSPLLSYLTANLRSTVSNTCAGMRKMR